MPHIVAQFNPNLPGQVQAFSTNLPNGHGRIVIWNASNVQLQLQCGAYEDFCPAWIGNLYSLDAGQMQVNWNVHSTLTSNGNPISLVVVLAYDDSEPIPTNFPVPLHFQTNIGNPGAVSNSASNLINDGNVAGTQIVESTPAGAPGSTVSILNDGTVTVQGYNAGVLTALIETVPGAAAGQSVVVLGDVNRRVEVLGTFKTGGALNVQTATLGHIAGSISGSADAYFDMRGTVNRLLMIFQNFQQGASTPNAITIPVGFSTIALYTAGNIAPVRFSAQPSSQFVTVNAATGVGSFAASASAPPFTWGDITAPFSYIHILPGNSTPATGVLTIEGI